MKNFVEIVTGQCETRIEVQVSEALVEKLEARSRELGCTVEEIIEHALLSVETP